MPEHTLEKAPQPLTVAELMERLEQVPLELRKNRILVRCGDEKDEFLHNRVVGFEICGDIDGRTYNPPLIRILRD